MYNIRKSLDPFLHNDACLVPQLKRFAYEKSVSDLIKFVSDIERIFMRISYWNFID